MMNKEQCNRFFERVLNEHKVTYFANSVAGKFEVKVYCKLDQDDYDASCTRFVEQFAAETKTEWIVYKRYGNQKKQIFRKTFKCQHSSVNKVKGERKYTQRVRDRTCNATIDFKVKKVCRNTWKNDPILKTGLNCIIHIAFDHNHSVVVAEAFSYLRCSKETVQMFRSYFDSGMTPAAAKNYHEIQLIDSSDDENEILKTLANAKINPTLRQIIHLFANWRKEKYGDRDQASVMEILKKKIEVVKEAGHELSINEESNTVVVVTPIMRRVFALEEAQEMIFVDSSGSCDQTNTCVTFVFCGSKVGALPLGCILHTALTEESYITAFTLLKNTLESNENKHFSPSVIMTDDCSAERNALQKVFPNASLLLCTFHVCQAVWRWLWDRDHNIDKDDRQTIMSQFQKVLYAETTGIAHECFENLIKIVKVKYPVAKKHFEALWTRKSEWCLVYREHLVTRGNNTNNFCEASIRIFKDVVLQRCRAFNSCALVDFICNVFDGYHKRRLIEFANSRRDQKLSYHYAKFLNKIDTTQIMKRNDFEYKVTSKKGDDIYTVNVKWQTCDCDYGRGGRYCKHMCAVEVKYNIQLSIRPLLSVEEKTKFAKVALGTSVSVDFLKGMDITDDIVPDVPDQALFERTTENVQTVVSCVNDSVTSSTQQLQCLREEFSRIVDIAETHSTSINAKCIKRTVQRMKLIKTPTQVLSFLSEQLTVMNRKKIRVQPTAISRRKERGITKGGGRIQSGRPAKEEATTAKKTTKRKHNLGLSIKTNRPNAKPH